MSELRDVVAYLATHYPYPEELSKARLTKLVYLADWEMAKRQGHQVTDIKWYFNHYGPYVRDIEDLASSSRDFDVDRSVNAFGSLKETISFIGEFDPTSLPDEEVEVLETVIADTQHMTFAQFIKHVYSTFPVQSSNKYDYLNLSRMASTAAK